MVDLISIIIPAYNAAHTIGRTLASAQGQVAVECEIIVVDDGSTDSTRVLVETIATRDPRIRLLAQDNGGVARARNLGVSKARGNFIAPLDADDLWHPEKLSRQLARLNESGPDVALAYNWFRRIDHNDMVISGSPHPRLEGRVFHRHLAWNFISNGSTPLIRSKALDSIGYDASLRDRGLQGCEDYMLQLQLSRRFNFACVPAFLTGYRRSPGAMSTHVERMIRSHIAMFEIVAGEVGGNALPIIHRQLARLHVELARNCLGKLNVRGAAIHLRRALAQDGAGTAQSLKRELRRSVSSTPYARTSGKPFHAFTPEALDGPWIAMRSTEALGELAALDLGGYPASGQGQKE